MLAGRLGTIELGKSVAQRIPPWLNRSSWPLAADRLRCKALARRCCLARGSSKRRASRSIELAHRCKALACRCWLARCSSKRQASRSSWAKPSWSERALVQVAERIAFSQTRWAISLLQAAGCWLLVELARGTPKHSECPLWQFPRTGWAIELAGRPTQCLEDGHFGQAAGCWLLAAGCWLLAAGCSQRLLSRHFRCKPQLVGVTYAVAA